MLYACSSSSANFMIVNYLLEQANANCNIPNDFNRNSLLIATRKNQITVVELLLKKGVDINFSDANGCNALHIACASGHEELASLLIDAGDAPSDSQTVTVQVDLSQFTLPIILANAQELAVHEDVLTQLDKSSGGQTVWRQTQVASA